MVELAPILEDGVPALAQDATLQRHDRLGLEQGIGDSERGEVPGSSNESGRSREGPRASARPKIARPPYVVMSASLIGRLGQAAFQAIHHSSVDVARWLTLLFGIGTKALVWGFLSQAG